MPGLGRRTFAAGEVLTASNVMGYLQDQAVMSFAGTAARGSAIPTPWQGATTFRQDTGTTEIYYDAFGTANPGGKTPAGWYREAGQVAQVQYKTTITSVTTASTSGVSTGLDYSFTPLFANSKIVVQAVINGIARDDGNAIGFQLTKAGTAVHNMYTFSSYNIGSFGQYFSVAGQYVETSGSTTARTYDVTFRRTLGSSNVTVQANDGASSIVIWEITQ